MACGRSVLTSSRGSPRPSALGQWARCLLAWYRATTRSTRSYSASSLVGSASAWPAHRATARVFSLSPCEAHRRTGAPSAGCAAYPGRARTPAAESARARARGRALARGTQTRISVAASVDIRWLTHEVPSGVEGAVRGVHGCREQQGRGDFWLVAADEVNPCPIPLSISRRRPPRTAESATSPRLHLALVRCGDAPVAPVAPREQANRCDARCRPPADSGREHGASLSEPGRDPRRPGSPGSLPSSSRDGSHQHRRRRCAEPPPRIRDTCQTPRRPVGRRHAPRYASRHRTDLLCCRPALLSLARGGGSRSARGRAPTERTTPAAEWEPGTTSRRVVAFGLAARLDWRIVDREGTSSKRSVRAGCARSPKCDGKGRAVNAARQLPVPSSPCQQAGFSDSRAGWRRRCCGRWCWWTGI